MLNYQRVSATKSFWWISWDEVLRSMILQKIASVWASEVTSWEQLLRHRTLVAVRLRHPVVKLGQLAPGQADMAVSSSVGSNIFDILVTWRSLNAGDMWWKFGARRKFMGQFPPERPTYIFIYIYIHTVYIHIYIYIFDGQNSQNHGFRWRFLENQSIDQRKKEPRRGLQNARWAYQFRGWSSMQSSRVAMVGQGWRFGALATHRLGLAFWKKIYGYIRVKKVKSQSTWLYRKIGFLWKYGHIVKSNLGVCNTNPYLGGHFWVFFSPFSNTPICINHFCYICVELLG